MTGFGLVGHLIEMTRASHVDAELYLSEIPLLDGARDTVAAGILSSLQPQNIRLRRAIQNIENASLHKDYPLLFDPQTAGGLLAGVPKANAEECLIELKQLGYHQACIIGKINSQGEHAAPIKIIC